MSNTLTSYCDRGLAVGAGSRGLVTRPNLVLGTTILASSLAFVDGSVLNVALPAIGRAFEAGTAEVQWVINAYLLPLSALLLIGGAAGDRYGRKRLLLAGIALFTAASLMCAAAPRLEIFLAGRACQGIGAAMLLPNSLAILSDAFSGERRGRAVGIWAAAGAVAGAVAPLLGGWLVDTTGWPGIFLINVPIAVAAIGLGLAFVPESANVERPPPDWAGAALATAALGALTWGLTAGSAGTAVATVWPAILASVLFSLLFLWIEWRRGPQAMVPLRLFGARVFVGLTIITFLLYGALGGLFVLLPYALIEGAGYSAVAAGAALLPLPLIIAAGSPLMGRIAERAGPKWPLTIGPLLVAAGFLLTSQIDLDGGYWSAVLPMMILISVGMAVAVAPLTTSVLGAVDKAHTGTASGLNSAVARIGGLIATALLGAVLAHRGQALLDGFGEAALVGAALGVISALCALLMLGGTEGGRHTI